MQIKKFISLFLVLALVLSVFAIPVYAVEDIELSSDVVTSDNVRYIVNEHFGLNDFGGFTLNSSSAGSVNSVEIAEDPGNYALEFSAGGRYWVDGEYALLNVDGADFKEGKSLIINTRIKLVGSGVSGRSPRAVFKYNKQSGVTDATENTGLFFTVGHDGLSSWAYNTAGTSLSVRILGSTSTTFADTWFNAEIIIKDAENATMEIYDDNGGTTGPIPFYLTGGITTGIENIFIRSDNGDKVYIDYIQIYEVSPVVKTTVPVNNTDYDILYRPEEISLIFSSPIDYIDGGIEIRDEMNNVVPDSDSGSYDEINRTYKVSFDTYLTAGNYKFIIKDTISPSSIGGVDDMTFESRDIPFSVYEFFPPKVEELTIEGIVAPGETITARYEFISETEADDNSIYTWFVSESGREGTFIPLESFNGTTLDVTEADVATKYVMFSVIPKSDGNPGVECFSNILVPETKPIVKDLKLSTKNLFPDFYVSPVYEFYDANGDYESGTVVEWYKSSDGVSNWTLIDTIEKYKITAEDIGFHLKCKVIPKSNSVYESTGEAVYSEVAGPVQDLLESTNLFVDPSFENTQIGEYWLSQPATGSGWRGVSRTTDDARTGSYALRQPPRVANNDTWRQYVDASVDNIYLLGCYAKKANDKLPDTGGFWPYPGSSGLERYDLEYNDYTYTLTKRWQLCVGTFETTPKLLETATKKAAFSFMSFETIRTLDAVIDDMYVGELLVADIETYDIGDITIPQGEDASYRLTSGKVLNQLGTFHGLKDQEVLYEFPETEGVSVKDGNLIVTNKAKAGRLNIKLYCIPTYPGADQSIFEKYVTVNLLPNNDTTPKAYDVTASGDVAEGNLLAGSYKFYQIEDKIDASTMQWTYCDTEDGEYKPILGANGLTYVVEGAYADKYIKFSVTPKTDDGLTGTTVYSDYVTIPRVPVAGNVTISGDFNVGGTVTAAFDFYDPNGDLEGTHIYNWMIDGVVVHTGKTLTFTESMIGKQIKVGVTPVSSNAPVNGVEVFSDSVSGPCAPTAQFVSIEKDNGRLVGHYIYNHIHGAKQKGTTFKWSVDGTVVSQERDYVPNFEGMKTVTFSVTPKSEGNPSTGQTVSVSISHGNAGTSTGGSTGGFTGGGSVGGVGGSGGSSGGGSGASGSGAGVTNINDMNRVDPTKESEKQPEATKSDIDNHWGKTYIDEMAKRGVMTADENGNFNPDINVSREEMVTFLFDALKLTESEYSSQFTDVADGDFAKKLQTMIDNGTIAKDTNFRPNDTISREEMCKILYVSLKNAGKLAEVEDGLINSFADFDNISDWARVYVNAIYGNKIMVGVSETEFDAKGTVTKAQAATMLVRILNLTEVE